MCSCSRPRDSIANPDAHQVTDFSDAEGAKLVFSNNGFHLDQSKASATPTALPAGLFATRANGTFDRPGERFVYDKSNSCFYPDADGSGAGHSRLLVATIGTLANRPAITRGRPLLRGVTAMTGASRCVKKLTDRRRRWL
jgi:hypothetical protein